MTTQAWKLLSTQFANVFQATYPDAAWQPYGASGLVRGDGQTPVPGKGYVVFMPGHLIQRGGSLGGITTKHERREGICYLRCYGPLNEAGKTARGFADTAKAALMWYKGKEPIVLGYADGVDVRVDSADVRELGNIGHYYLIEVSVRITVQGWKLV